MNHVERKATNYVNVVTYVTVTNLFYRNFKCITVILKLMDIYMYNY